MLILRGLKMGIFQPIWKVEKTYKVNKTNEINKINKVDKVVGTNIFYLVNGSCFRV